MSFKGKTVVITGGASGIGFLTGKNMAHEGAKVVLVDVNEEALSRCVEELRAIPAEVLGFAIDVRDYPSVCRVRDETVKAFGSIDVLVCCAGGAEMRLCNQDGPFWETPIDVYDFSIDLNLKGVLYFDHAVMSQMVKQNSGVIIHLGSITGADGCRSNVGYSTSKSALMNGMTRSIALAGAEHHIRCVCVAPGPVLTRTGMANMKTLEGRAAQPQEIVDLILYVASEKGDFINGTTFLIDGGRHIMVNKW